MGGVEVEGNVQVGQDAQEGGYTLFPNTIFTEPGKGTAQEDLLKRNYEIKS
jgi:hypothetical protein